MNRRLGAGEVVLLLIGPALAFAAIANGREEWVETAVFVSLLAGFVVEPLLVLAHELGHAAAAVALSGRRVRIQIGEQPFAFRVALGAIDIHYASRGYVAHCELDGSTRLTARGWLLVALAGPGVSLLLGLGLAVIAIGQQNGSDVLFWTLVLAAGSSLFLGLGNAVPFRRLPGWWPGAMRYEEGPSDGYLALMAMRGEHPGARVAAPPGPSGGMSKRARRVVGGRHGSLRGPWRWRDCRRRGRRRCARTGSTPHCSGRSRQLLLQAPSEVGEGRSSTFDFELAAEYRRLDVDLLPLMPPGPTPPGAAIVSLLHAA